MLWQAVGLGGRLSILGAGVTLGISGLHRSWLAGLGALPMHGADLGPVGWTGVALTVVAGSWLVLVLAVSSGRLAAARRAHRARLDLLADDVTVAPAGGTGRPLPVRLLDHPVAAAYCLLGIRPRIVLSQGVLDALSPGELAAVVAHERAHARGYHDLVIQPFRAWRQTFPFLPAAAAALAAVELLVEMLADDVAAGGAPPHR